jgi:SAM-dependent methyltransferase
MKEEEIREKATLDCYLELVEKDVKKIFLIDDFDLINCPACNCADSFFEFEKLGFRYVSCKNCQTLFASFRPTQDKLKEFYVHSDSSAFWVDKFFKPVAEARRSNIFKPLAKKVNILLSKTNANLIGDIGAGFGMFLEELKKINNKIQIIAIEPSPEMAQICKAKGIEVIPCLLEEIDDKYYQSFSFLTSFELIEHLLNPQHFLQKIYNMLKFDGYFFFTTLNGKGFDLQVLWGKSKSVFPPHHLNFFNPHSISILLKKVGFTIVEIKTPGRLDWDIVEGAIKKDGFEAGRFWNMLANESSGSCKEDLQKWISEYGFSSHMQVLAKKV